MQHLNNPHRGAGLTSLDAPAPSTDAAAVHRLLTRCPAFEETPLTSAPGLATAAGVATLSIKDERGRMGLGSFKALGAAYVIASDAEEGRAAGTTYVTASAGNHGLSVAAGARIFGAAAVIYLARTVPEVFAERLRSEGAQVKRAGNDYAASMEAAMAAAADNGWTLLSDTSWPGYTEIPHRLMEGYTQMMAEVIAAMPEAPSHVYLQAGVGGLAGAVAAMAREHWGEGPQIIVVEPDVAPAIMEALRAGAIVEADGPESSMGRLDCKEASLIALKGLARDADRCITLTDAEVEEQLPLMAAHGFATTGSGGAGVAAALLDDLPKDARVLCILSEQPE